MFQFLIGSLVTITPIFYNFTLKLFQFLIGSLVTYIIYIILLYLLMFQFLIGSLVTMTTLYSIVACYKVSIPYR